LNPRPVDHKSNALPVAPPRLVGLRVFLRAIKWYEEYQNGNSHLKSCWFSKGVVRMPVYTCTLMKSSTSLTDSGIVAVGLSLGPQLPNGIVCLRPPSWDFTEFLAVIGRVHN